MHRPAGGAGRGKDMANIIQAAERARESSRDQGSTDTGTFQLLIQLVVRQSVY